MPSIPPKPLLVLARLDATGETELLWWLRSSVGLYDAITDWPGDGHTPFVDRFGVEPHRLMPAVTDFERDRGDNIAIVEIHNARDKHAASQRS